MNVMFIVLSGSPMTFFDAETDLMPITINCFDVEDNLKVRHSSDTILYTSSLPAMFLDFSLRFRGVRVADNVILYKEQ